MDKSAHNMTKTAGAAGRVLRDLGEAFRRNPPPTGKLVANVAGGAAIGPAIVLLAEKLKKNKSSKRTLLRKAIVASVAGAGAGAFRAYASSYMYGRPFENELFDPSGLKKGDKVYIGVAGATGDGTPNGTKGVHEGWLEDVLHKHFGAKNVLMFNPYNEKGIEKAVRELTDKGLVPVIVAHSHGGKAAASVLSKFKNAKGYLIDPVSWTGRKKLDNTIYFTPDESMMHETDDDFYADVGGRWAYSGPGAVRYKGTHSDSVWKLVDDFPAKGIDRSNMQDHTRMPEYVTHAYW